MKSIREKEQHRRECFFASGVFTGVIWSVASWKYLWAVIRIEMNGVLQVLGSLIGMESGKLRGVGRISGVVPLLQWTGIEKEPPLPPSFSLYHGTPYIFVLFLFSCSWIGLSAPALAYLVFGTGVVYTLERCLVCPCPGWTGFFYKYFFSPWLASGVLGALDTCHDQIQRGYLGIREALEPGLHCSGRLHLRGYC